MTTMTLKREIKSLARKSVREALSEELMRIRAGYISSVSAREQKEIESRYGTPSRKGTHTLRVRI